MHRMRVLAALQDARGVDVVRAVEGDHQRGVAGQALQQVHAVTHGAGLRRIRRQVRVPRRPCLAVARQQARIGMQHGVVGLVADRAEDVALGIAGIIQQVQRLVAVAGQHDLVEAFAAGIAAHAHAMGVAGDAAHRRGQPHLHVPVRDHRLDIAPRTATHHPPLRAAGQLQHVVVGHELDQVFRRERQHRLLGRGPQRAGHRHQVLVAERSAIAVGVEVLAQRRARVVVVEQGRCFAIEARQVAQHAPEARRGQVAALAEQPVERGRVVFQPGARVLHREPHRGRLRGHAEFVEQAGQQRIVAGVVDDEASVHVERAAIDFDPMGVGVAAEVIVGLEQDDVVLARQQPRRRQAADPGTDDRDAHLSDPPCSHRLSPAPTPAPA